MRDSVSERIDQCKQLIEAMDCSIDWIGDNLIVVDCGLWQIYIDEKFAGKILLALHVNICPLKAADITKRFSYLASLIDMDVIIQDVYAFELDEDGMVTELTFGPDAYKTVGRKHYLGLHQ